MSKQFGDQAQRVSNQEMWEIHDHLMKKVGGKFCAFQLTRTLEEKQDHGDIDILVLTHPDQNARKVIEEDLKPEVVVRNGHCISFLYDSHLGKKVHVDFLVSDDPNLHATRIQYYAFNDLSSTVGIVAKALNFKYGTEGFFKRYQDKRNNWHDILVSVNLNPGLECLGYEPKPLWIKTWDDIATYVASSLMFDSSMFEFALEGDGNDKRKSGEVWRKLASLGKKAAITDPDYFFKRKYAAQYAEVQDRMKQIESEVYQQSRFNGWWLMSQFPVVKPGKQVGLLLKAISDHFGERLNDASEEEVVAFVKGIVG